MLNQALIDQLEMIAHQHGEPYDFLERRCAALNAYHPERADSFATAMLNAGLTWPASAPAAPMAASLGLQLTGTGASQVRLPEALRTQRVLLMDLFEAARIHPRLLDRFLMTKACQPTGNRLALHRAFLNAGIFVYVPTGVRIAQPLILQASYAGPTPLHFHTLVVAERGSRIQIHQDLTFPQALLSTVVTEAIAQADSRIDYRFAPLTSSNQRFICQTKFCRPGGQVHWQS